MQSEPMKRPVVMSIMFAEILSAVLLLLGGFLLLDASFAGLVGGATLFLSGLIGIVLSILSFVTASGLRDGKRWSWGLARMLSAITIVLSSGLLAVAATLTGNLSYPGLAIVLLIIVNDTIIAEAGVIYFLTKPEIRASLGK